MDENRHMIENIDATITAQRPKMRPYIDTMRQNIADALCIEIDQVNVSDNGGRTWVYRGRRSKIFSKRFVRSRNIQIKQQYGCLSDCGMCGGCCSGIGRNEKSIIRKLEQSEHIATRKLWKKYFGKIRSAFLDYYYYIKAGKNQIYVVEEMGEFVQCFSPYESISDPAGG